MSFHSPRSGVSQKDGIFNKIQRKGYVRELGAELGESKSRDGEAPGPARGLKVQEDRATHRGRKPRGQSKEEIGPPFSLPASATLWPRATIAQEGAENKGMGNLDSGQHTCWESAQGMAASHRPALRHQGMNFYTSWSSLVTTAAPKDLQQMVCNSDEQELLTS